ncbi:hypothetical protein ACWIGI_16645 [Nocardia sp. NPDC055321]
MNEPGSAHTAPTAEQPPSREYADALRIIMAANEFDWSRGMLTQRCGMEENRILFGE